MSAKIGKEPVNVRAYFDHNATTPVSSEALEAMLPVFTATFGNPSSIHQAGQLARQSFESARRHVARLLSRKPTEIVFTGGGTESDNLAILGSVRAAAGRPQHVITTAIEHPAVLAACRQLEKEGVAVTYLPVGASGVVDPSDVRRALTPETTLISVMHANNELGTIQPVEEIARIAAEAGVLFHSDGVQAAGKLDLRHRPVAADLYTISGHKLGAPKGIGVLAVKDGTQLVPLTFGGRQERERRPGTENVAGAVAIGRAAEWVLEHGDAERARLAQLRDRLEQGILSTVDRVHVNSANSPRTPNTTNIRFDGIEGEAMVIALDLRGFAVSSGAACSSGAIEPSHVLTAIGLSRSEAKSSIRFSLGRGNDESQVDALIEAVAASVAHLRRIAPPI